MERWMNEIISDVWEVRDLEMLDSHKPREIKER